MPDSIQWVTGTMAKNILRFNPSMRGAIVSGSVLPELLARDPGFIQRFDLVHFLCQYSSKEWLPRLAPYIPVVTTLHHVAEWALDKHNLDADSVMVVAREWEEDLRARGVGMEKVFRYSNGVDTRKFSPPTEDERVHARLAIGIPQNNVVVGFFAKIGSNNDNDRKGTDVFCAAGLQLAAKLPDATILILGPGWHDLVARLRAAGLHCVWLPFVEDTSTVAKIYRALDFYWITSRVEGGPVPLLEAMSTGVCCLTTPVGLVPEIGQTGVNLLVLPFDDPTAFAVETVRLAAKVHERTLIGKAARNTILEKKDLSVTTHAICRGYDLAFNNFSKRLGQPRTNFPCLEEIPPKVAEVNSSLETGEIMPLEGIPAEIHDRLHMLENIHWGESLFNQGQHHEGIRWLFRECRAHPNSLTAWRHLLRCLLPQPIVALVVKVKNIIKKNPSYEKMA